MTSRRLLVLPLLLIAALLVGCGSDDPEPSDTSNSSERGSGREADEDEESTDDGERAGTDDFTFAIPEGWTDNSTALPNAEIAYISSEVVDNFRTNINIIRTPGDKMSISRFEELAISELEGEGFTGVAADDPYEVDGVESPVVRADAVVEGVSYQTRQYYAQYEGAYYIITISFAPSASEAETVEVSEQIIDSWRWES
ncbi:hypothetical protein [Aeromicrobium sp. Leaf350]|uniref:hypothetical protein n=1 Tax=Aeromicrobium sp. Leaf350 TaxID=2876565 RepID=UPI001E355876|nr:hypothetical protein [Aeromicrobium sp. Leaf350]